MDLRSVLNTSDNADPSRAPPPPPPAAPHQAQQPRHSPGQRSPPPFGYRDYNYQHPPLQSPVKAVAPGFPQQPQQQQQQQQQQQPPQPQQQQQHSPPPPPPNPYPSPSPYHGPPQYQSRPQPPPLQPSAPYPDVRSPGIARSNSTPIASPYRATSTPTSAPPSSVPAYPFPPTQASQEVASPGQRYQYPPAPFPHQKRDSYSQGAGPPAHPAPPYGKQQSPPLPPQQQPSPQPQPQQQQQQQRRQQHQTHHQPQSQAQSQSQLRDHQHREQQFREQQQRELQQREIHQREQLREHHLREHQQQQHLREQQQHREQQLKDHQQREQQREQQQREQQQREQQQREQQQREQQQREQQQREQQQREQQQREQQQREKQQREQQQKELEQREQQQRELQQREQNQREQQQREQQQREQHQREQQQREQQQREQQREQQRREQQQKERQLREQQQRDHHQREQQQQQQQLREQQQREQLRQQQLRDHQPRDQQLREQQIQEQQSRDQQVRDQQCREHQVREQQQQQQQQQRRSPGSQSQQQHPVRQASPIVAASGATHPYVQQRSHSTQSTPTPQSAQREGHYGPPYAQGSPILATQPPPDEYTSSIRHPSHPPTPLGPPPAAATPRQAPAPSNLSQPSSPYQQRMSSIGSAQTQPSPIPTPTPLPAHRLSNSHSALASPVSESSQHRALQYDRERSVSVSPKTQVETLAVNPDQTPTPVPTAPEPKQALRVQSMAIETERAVTPAKRKLGDLNMSPGELEHRESRPPPGEVNGGYAERIEKSPSTVAPRKRRVVRSQPPIWAQSVHSIGKRLPNNPNFVLQKRMHAHIHPAPVNGKPDVVVKTENASRHASPESTRPQHGSQAQAPPILEPGPQDLLGPWEPSIIGTKPYEELVKTVADFLFLNVVTGPDSQEVSSRGIQYEIEAKLGTLIDKSTNQRVDRLLDSECILSDRGRIAFKSSMTELHHKAFNDFLNKIVIQTDPRAPHGGSRVQLVYKHRREVDRFFDLSPDLQKLLPACMQTRLGARGKNVRVRVTYDQKTNEPLNKIIKARVADIDIHLPMCPMDCRISVNLEMDWEGSVEELVQTSRQGERQPDRSKDRLSYTQGHYQIDLTQVTYATAGPGNTQRIEKEHELEIELSAGVLIDQGRRAMDGAPHRYQELVAGFIDNVRVLARKANEFTKV